MHTKILKKCILKLLKNVYNENYSSPESVEKSAKRHFTDPSLACACLDLFMCVVVGYTDAIAKDPETGIYIVPITALKP